LFVLPSRSEPFAVSVLEAMAQGTPVLISSSGGAASYVLPRINGETFFEWSYISFQKKLTRLLEDPEQLLVLGENARKKVVDECSGESLISFLDDLLTPKLQRLETQ
jgi:glycosyltransferase involved in cell wall biosynthesis